MRPFRRFKLAHDVRARLSEHLKNKPSLGIVKVTHYFEREGDHNKGEVIVAEQELVLYLSALMQLHVNEAEERGATPVVAITVASLHAEGPYWWSTPGLKDNNDPRGASVLEWSILPALVWRRAGSELPKALQHSGYETSPLSA